MCLGDWLGNTGEPRPGVRLAEKTNPGEMARRTPTDREFREWVREMYAVGEVIPEDAHKPRKRGMMTRFHEALDEQ